MHLSTAQLQTLKTDITVTRAAVVYQGQTLLEWWNAGNDQMIANFYNQPAAPVVKLWKPSLPVSDLNEALVGTEFIALAQANRELWFVMTQGPANTTVNLTRTNFVSVFGGASATMANLTVKAQKDATYAESLFSVSGGSPGTGNVSSVFGQVVDGTEVGQARFV